MSIKKLYLKKLFSPIRLVGVLALFLLPMSTMSCTAMKSKSKKQEPVAAAKSANNTSTPVPPPPPNVPPHQQRPTEMILRVAVVRPAGDDGFITVGFLRSQRFYKIAKDANPAFLEILRDSEKNQSSVSITLANQDSDIIIGVRKMGR